MDYSTFCGIFICDNSKDQKSVQFSMFMNVELTFFTLSLSKPSIFIWAYSMNTAQNSIKQQLSINWSILKIDTHTHTLKFSLNAYFKSIYCKLKLFLCCFLFVCHKCMMHETTEHCEKTKQWKIWSKFVQLNHRLKLMPNWKLDSHLWAFELENSGEKIRYLLSYWKYIFR